MKQFLKAHILKKRWHGIPVGVISAVLAVCLLIGGVLAACTTSHQVKEPEVVYQVYEQLNSGPNGSGTFETQDLIITAHPGESVTRTVRVTNESSVPLTVNMTPTLTDYPEGGWGEVTVTGGPDGTIIYGGTYWQGNITGTIADDAPPGNYTIRVSFSRN